MQSKPWFETPAEAQARIGDSAKFQRCTCCDQPLKRRYRMLELDQRTNTYHDFHGVPEDQSQGWFPFGLTCAKNKLAEAKAPH